MAIEFPTRKQLEQTTKTDVQQELENSNPFLRNSFLGAIVSAWAFRIYDFYIQLGQVLQQAFWDTSSGEYLERQAGWFGITRNPATKSEGNVVSSGVAGSSIASGSTLQDSDGEQYESTTTVSLSTNALSVSTLTRSGTVATANFASAHNLASGISVTISGANETAYNGTFVITATDADTFTYTISGSPASPATGTIISTQTTAVVPVESTDFGVGTNQDSGAELRYITPISGVDNASYVDTTGIDGGADQETDTDFRERFLDRVQNPIALFNVSAIENQAKLVSGVTRVFVREITPAEGQVTVYFVLDNEDNIIPTATDVSNVKDSILEIKPAHTADADVIVEAPVAKTVNFSFSSLVPNTTTMQESVTSSLEVLFRDDTDVGVDLIEDAYRSSIYNTADEATGDRVESFTLTTPTGDIAVASNEIPTLGTVTF